MKSLGKGVWTKEQYKLRNRLCLVLRGPSASVRCEWSRRTRQRRSGVQEARFRDFRGIISGSQAHSEKSRNPGGSLWPDILPAPLAFEQKVFLPISLSVIRESHAARRNQAQSLSGGTHPPNY